MVAPLTGRELHEAIADYREGRSTYLYLGGASYRPGCREGMPATKPEEYQRRLVIIEGRHSLGAS